MNALSCSFCAAVFIMPPGPCSIFDMFIKVYRCLLVVLGPSDTGDVPPGSLPFGAARFAAHSLCGGHH